MPRRKKHRRERKTSQDYFLSPPPLCSFAWHPQWTAHSQNFGCISTTTPYILNAALFPRNIFNFHMVWRRCWAGNLLWPPISVSKCVNCDCSANKNMKCFLKQNIPDEASLASHRQTWVHSPSSCFLNQVDLHACASMQAACKLGILPHNPWEIF